MKQCEKFKLKILNVKLFYNLLAGNEICFYMHVLSEALFCNNCFILWNVHPVHSLDTHLHSFIFTVLYTHRVFPCNCHILYKHTSLHGCKIIKTTWKKVSSFLKFVITCKIILLWFFNVISDKTLLLNNIIYVITFIMYKFTCIRWNVD